MIRQLYLQPPSQNPPIQTLYFNLHSHKWPALLRKPFSCPEGVSDRKASTVCAVGLLVTGLVKDKEGG